MKKHFCNFIFCRKESPASFFWSISFSPSSQFSWNLIKFIADVQHEEEEFTGVLFTTFKLSKSYITISKKEDLRARLWNILTKLSHVSERKKCVKTKLLHILPSVDQEAWLNWLSLTFRWLYCMLVGNSQIHSHGLSIHSVTYVPAI